VDAVRRRIQLQPLEEVASAVGDGATAVRLAHEYLAAGDEDELALVSGG